MFKAIFLAATLLTTTAHAEIPACKPGTVKPIKTKVCSMSRCRIVYVDGSVCAIPAPKPKKVGGDK